jgi:5,10-methylenetetrahydromethanopterin reductase
MNGIELTPEHPIERLATLAERAEREGFDVVFTSCHYNNRDPFAALSAIADATDGVQVGPGVVNPYETHPAALASRVATLDELSDGRGIFGLGAGDRSTLRALGIEQERPLRRVLETMRVSRQLWAGERVSHDGTFTATDARLNYDVEGSIPVYVGGQGPDMLRMAAKHADGVLINASHPDDVAWARERVEEGLAEREAAERARKHFETLAFASVSVADDAEAAREAARPPVAFIVGGADERVLERHGVDTERATEIGTAIEAGQFRDAFAAVTDRMIGAFCVAGTVETVATDLAALQEHVDGVVVGAPLGPDLETAVELAAKALDRVA